MIAKLVVCAAWLLIPPATLSSESAAAQKPSLQAESSSSDARLTASQAREVAKSSTPKSPEEVSQAKSPWLPIELNIVKYTNQQRVEYGLPELEIDPALMKSARDHTAWMARNRSLVHTRRAVAENIAMGQPHSRSVVRAWMNSSGHRANILNRAHRRIGVAAYRSAGGTIYWCQQFGR